MDIKTQLRYKFDVTSRELTYIRHALTLAIEHSEGLKRKAFIELHNEISERANTQVKELQRHFESILSMEIKE